MSFILSVEESGVIEHKLPTIEKVEDGFWSLLYCWWILIFL